MNVIPCLARVRVFRPVLGLWFVLAGMLAADPVRGAAPVQVGAVPLLPRMVGVESVALATNLGGAGKVHALVSAGVAGVHVVDVSSVIQPVRVGVYETRGRVNAVALAGTRAFVADGPGGLVVLDVSDPAAPVRLGGVQGILDAVDVAVDGTRVYVADRAGALVIVDGSDAREPRVLGMYVTGEPVNAVGLAGARVGLGRSSGFEVLDVSNPLVPVRTGFLPTLSAVTDCSVVGGFGYVTDRGGLLTVVEVGGNGGVTARGRVLLEGAANGVTAPGGAYVYVAAGVAGMGVIDVTSPDAPLRVAGVSTGGESVHVAVRAGYAYTADRVGGVRIFALANLARQGAVPSGGRILDVAVEGFRVGTAEGAAGLQLYDFTSPGSPQDLGRVVTEQPAVTVAIAGRTAYVGMAGRGGSGLQVFDLPPDVSVANPPGLLGTHRISDVEARVSGVAVAGTQVFLAAGAAGLVVVDASDPADLRERARVPVPGGAWGVAVSGGYAYVAAGDQGFKVVDVGDPDAARVVGGVISFGAGAVARGLAIRGRYAYVAADSHGLQVLDIQDPLNPKKLEPGGRIDTSGLAARVATDGGLAFVADGESGILVLDLDRGDLPVVVGVFDTDGSAGGVAVANGHLLVADDSRLVVMAVAGLTSGTNQAPSFVIREAAVADEDAGNVVITNWVSQIRPGGEDENWQEVSLSLILPAGFPTNLFAVPPTLSSDGTLRFRPAANEFGQAGVTVRIRDNGGTDNGGVDVYEVRNLILKIRPVNDPPLMDSTSDLGWRRDREGTVRVLTGILPGPPNEFGDQRIISVQAQSGRPDVVPHPVADYPYEGDPTQAALRFTSFGDRSLQSIELTITLTDSGGTENGGINRLVRVQNMSVNPISGVQIIDPVEGQTVSPIFRTYNVSAFASYEDGPVKRADLLVNGVLRYSTDSILTDVDVALPWTIPGRGVFQLEVVSTDPRNYAVTSAPVRVVVGTAPILQFLGGTNITTREDGVSTALEFRATDGAETRATNLTVRAVSADPLLLPESGLTLSGTDFRRFLTVLPGPNRFGTGNVRIVVTDEEGLTATQEVRVTVEAVNDAPTARLLEPSEGARFVLGQSIHLVADATDVEGPLRQVEFLSGSGRLALLSAPPFEFTWTNAPLGEHALTVRAEDGVLSATSQVVRVTIVRPPNRPPDIQGARPIEVIEDGASEPLFLTMTDETAEVDLKVTATSTDAGLVGAAGLGLVHTTNGWQLTVVPVRDAFGSATIVVVATDAEGLSATNRIPLTVAPVDDPPTVVLRSPIQGTVFPWGESVPLRVEADDVDGKVASLAVFSDRSSTSLARFGTPPYAFLWTPAQAGTHLLTVRVRSTNEAGVSLQSTSAPVRITVEPKLNRPPVITGGSAIITDEDTLSAPMTVTVTDEAASVAGLEVVAFAADRSLVPAAGVTVVRSGNAWTVTLRPGPDRFGATTLFVVATDPGLASSTNTYTVTVRPVNDAPVVALTSPGDGAVVEVGTTIRMEATAVDVEGAMAEVGFFDGDRLLATDDLSPFEHVWSGADPGVHVLTARATDGEGLSVTSAPVRITVMRPPNRPPVITGGGAVVTDEDAASAPMLLIVTDDSTPAEGLRVEATVLEPELVPGPGVSVTRIDENWQVIVMPGLNRFGATVVRVVATDQDGASSTSEYPLTVRPVNDAPDVVLTSPRDGAVVEPGTTIRIVATAEDVEGVVAQVGFFDGDRLLATAVLSPFEHVWSGAALGVHEITARATDGEGLSVTSAPVRITVTPPANRAPTITGGGPLTLYRDGASLPIPLGLADDRTPVEGLVLSAKASNPGLFSRAGMILAGGGGVRTLTLVPEPGAFGNAVIELTVSDGEGLSGTTAFPVTVLPVSELPGGEPCFADAVPEGFGTFNLLKTGAYRQEVGSSPAGSGAAASIELRAPPRYRVSSATVLGTGGFRAVLARRDDGLFTWSDRGDEGPLLSGLPFGSWTTSFRLVLTNGEALNGFFPFVIVSNVPPVPRVLNLEAGQAINAGAPFALSWVPWAGSGTNDRVILTIVDDVGNLVVSAASDCSGQTVLPRRSAGFELPPGRLTAGTRYTGFLTFAATQLAVNDRSPLLMLRAFHSRTTQFSLRTGGSGGAGVAGTFGVPRVFGSSLVATLRGTPGVEYRVESSADFVAWGREQDVVIPSDGTAELALPLGLSGGGRFYRTSVSGGP